MFLLVTSVSACGQPDRTKSGPGEQPPSAVSGGDELQRWETRLGVHPEGDELQRWEARLGITQ
jgi:hypothetical protein